MKTILMVLALAGITTAGSYAQNTKNCCCASKTTHKVAVAHHKARRVNKIGEYMLAPVETLTRVNTTVEKDRNEACYTYRKHNIVVTECPGTMYDDVGGIEYGTQGVYMGYYPKGAPDDGADMKNAPIAPQHTTINNYKGIAPADGNYCPQCSPQ